MRWEKGRNEGWARVAQFPGRRIIMGAPNHCGWREMTAGDEKSPNNVTSTFFNTVQCFRKTSGSNMRRQTSFLPQVPSNLVTPLTGTPMEAS